MREPQSCQAIANVAQADKPAEGDGAKLGGGGGKRQRDADDELIVQDESQLAVSSLVKESPASTPASTPAKKPAAAAKKLSAEECVESDTLPQTDTDTQTYRYIPVHSHAYDTRMQKPDAI